MSTLRLYFEREAETSLGRMASLGEEPATASTRLALYRAARELRGAAQLAREAHVHHAARAVETALRPDGVAGVAGVAPAALEALLAGTVAELRALVRGVADEDEAAARADALAARWADASTAGPGAAAWPDAASSVGERGVDDAGGAADERGADEGDEAAAFQAFAAAEVGAIVAALESGVAALAAEPLDRASLGAVVRRQRALLGAARLDEIPVVAETLQAVEDVARVIARLGVGVKGEWLDVFRSARDVLSAATGSLEAGGQPQPSNALSRLRTLRAELLERYGHAADTLVPGVVAGPGPDAVADAVVDAAPDAVVDVATLCYDRDAALRRALALRGRVERAVGADEDAREAVDEIFDLLRIALG